MKVKSAPGRDGGLDPEPDFVVAGEKRFLVALMVSRLGTNVLVLLPNPPRLVLEQESVQGPERRGVAVLDGFLASDERQIDAQRLGVALPVVKDAVRPVGGGDCGLEPPFDYLTEEVSGDEVSPESRVQPPRVRMNAVRPKLVTGARPSRR